MLSLEPFAIAEVLVYHYNTLKNKQLSYVA